MLFDVHELALEKGDAPVDLAAVNFQLRLTGAAHAHATASATGTTARLAGQVGPCPRQPGEAVLVLRQLNLHRSLAGAGVAGKDVQNERGAVDDLHLFAQCAFNLALLAWGEFVVEDDHVGPALQHRRLKFFQLARADQRGRIWRVQPLGHLADHFQTSRVRQERELVERIVQGEQAGLTAEFNAHKHGPFGGRRRGYEPLLIANNRAAAVPVTDELLAGVCAK
jgi:hypothetical protein